MQAYAEFTPLHEASRDGDVNRVKEIFQNNPNILNTLAHPISPLWWACRCGKLEVVKILIEFGSPLSSSNFSPLHEAVSGGHEELVKILIEKGVDIEVNFFNQTPLCVAADKGHLEVVKILVENGANINVNQSSPLLYATTRGYIDVMKYLLSKGADLKDGYILSSAVFHGKYYAVELLLQSGVKVDTLADGRTSLTLAVKDNRKEITKLLLDYGASPDAIIVGEPVIYVAASCGYLEITKLLLQNGANVNIVVHQSTPFYIACTQRNLKMIELLWNFGANVEGVEGKESPLCMAINNRYWDVVDFLIDHHVDVNRRAANLMTPLHLLSKNKSPEILSLAEKIIRHGAKVNATWMDKAASLKGPPLYFAVKHNFADMVWLLVFAGADVNCEIQDEFSETIWELSGIEPATYKALLHFWEPSTHFRHPQKVRDAIFCTLLIAKRLKWHFDDLLLHRLCSFIAYGWI